MAGRSANLESKKKRDAGKSALAKQSVYPKIKSYDPKVWYSAHNKLYDEKNINAVADAMLKWASEKIETGDHLLVGDFSIEFMVPDSRFPEFCRKSTYFAFVYSLVKKMQEQYFAKRGLSKEGNPAMEIFLLKAIHKYMEANTTKLYNIDFSKLNNEQLTMLASGSTIEEVLIAGMEKKE